MVPEAARTLLTGGIAATLAEARRIFTVMWYVTLLDMILRFRHRGLERLYSRGDTSGVSAQHVKRLRAMLAALATASVRCRLHPLRGDRVGQWSVSISGNWRVIFEFEGQDVMNVDLVDYH